MKSQLNIKKMLFMLLFLSFSNSFAGFELKRYSINSGSSKQNLIKNNRYEIKSSIGQADASGTLQASTYQLNGGFWHQNTDLIFKNNLD